MSGQVMRRLCAAIAVIAMLLMGVSALADSIEVKLNTSAKVYQSASSSSRYVKTPKGLKVTLKAYAKGWGKITYKGRTGYIKLKYLDRVEPLKAYVTENATVYKEASNSRRLCSVNAGQAVYVLGVDGSYVRIRNKSGSKKGYIEAGLLSTASVSVNATVAPDSEDNIPASEVIPEALRATKEDAKESKIEQTIYVAQSLIGTPYASNAHPPKTFDCAKYASYCYGKAESGVLRNSSKTQGYDERYEKIDYDDLKRGDLVCFDTISDGDLSDHVGIYLGSGYFLHGSSAAKKVILSSLSSGYYKRTFSWGRRIFED